MFQSLGLILAPGSLGKWVSLVLVVHLHFFNVSKKRLLLMAVFTLPFSASGRMCNLSFYMNFEKKKQG